MDTIFHSSQSSKKKTIKHQQGNIILTSPVFCLGVAQKAYITTPYLKELFKQSNIWRLSVTFWECFYKTITHEPHTSQHDWSTIPCFAEARKFTLFLKHYVRIYFYPTKIFKNVKIIRIFNTQLLNIKFNQEPVVTTSISSPSIAKGRSQTLSKTIDGDKDAKLCNYVRLKYSNW